MPKLEIQTPRGKRTLAFSKPVLKLGRLPENDIVLDDPAASRRHCELRLIDGQCQLVDLKSHNGTWIGENRILEATLSYGDVVRIGGTFIRLLPDEEAPAQPEALPTAEVLIDEAEEELPAGSLDKTMVATTLAVRSMAGGPLAKQLAPLLAACVNVPPPPGAPNKVDDVKLLNRRSVPITAEGKGAAPLGDAIRGLMQLLFAAFRTRATDIHIEPEEDRFSLRLRIDGVLHGVGHVVPKTGLAILNVIKVLCEIDIAKKNVVQEGRFTVALKDRRIDFRISFTPSVHGQKMALRILDKAAVPAQLENLGMELDSAGELAHITAQDAGMIILSGPTGSGKTTTLYTLIRGIDPVSRNIVTIEDPVEYEMPGTTQISIDPLHDLTFASVLASVLRQDPDVILVGEIRDHDTAKLAMNAATTGHLVLTTIHARDSIGTVFRMLDLGIEPYLIANAVSVCSAQRLVRTLCPYCKRPFKPDTRTIRLMKLEGRPYGQLYDSQGCKKCMGTGYLGRTALFEMLTFTPAVRDVILTRPTISDIRKAAGEWGFRTLTEAGYRKVLEGMTSLQEVERVSGMT